jgi:hypothetical protein
MKSLIVIFTFIISVSCLNDRDYHEKFTGPVRIDSLMVPPIAEVAKKTGIYAIAVADNGCWRNLHFTMTAKNMFEYEIKAFGNYESYGACPDVLVGNDTLIQFIPTAAGKHFFYTTISPGTVRMDTMLVN